MGATIRRVLNAYMDLNHYWTSTNSFMTKIVEAPFRPTGGGIHLAEVVHDLGYAILLH